MRWFWTPFMGRCREPVAGRRDPKRSPTGASIGIPQVGRRRLKNPASQPTVSHPAKNVLSRGAFTVHGHDHAGFDQRVDFLLAVAELPQDRDGVLA